jgi:23S rRNA (guanosine2251-2'-O)-methyltransferase
MIFCTNPVVYSLGMKHLVLIAHNIRSTHNVGSLLRSSDGFGVYKVFLTGYTPYPLQTTNDPRLPHIATKLDKQITKTALGAEKSVTWEHTDSIEPVLEILRADGYTIAAIEQAPASIALNAYIRPDKLAIIVGREVEGIESEVLAKCDAIVEIPMHGDKESFNVAVAGAIALYQLSL